MEFLSIYLVICPYMPDSISRLSVRETLPALRKIFAEIEVGFTTVEDPEKCKDLFLKYVEDELGPSYTRGMDIITVWLRGSSFGANFARIWKLNPDAKWSELMSILNEKMNEYANEAPIIELHLSKAGLMTRNLNDTILECQFERNSMKMEILIALRDGEYVQTETLRGLVGSDSTDSISKTIEKINNATRAKLQLPKSKRLIENDPGSGYYIEQTYNLVVK